MNRLSFECKSSGYKNEAEFTTWFGRKVKDQGGFFHKISDMSREQKPYDAIMALDGIVAAIEFKYDKSKRFFYPFRLLRGSSVKNPGTQVVGLEKFSTNGGQSFVCVYNPNINDYWIIPFEGIDFNTKITIGEEDIQFKTCGQAG